MSDIVNNMRTGHIIRTGVYDINIDRQFGTFLRVTCDDRSVHRRYAANVHATGIFHSSVEHIPIMTNICTYLRIWLCDWSGSISLKDWLDIWKMENL